MRPFLFFLLCISQVFAENIAYFIPPKNWKEMDPKVLTPYVQIGYVGSGKTSFAPSVNVACEEVGKIKAEEYLEIVQKLHTAQPNTSWRKLGKLKTKAGNAFLTEVTVKKEANSIKLLQCIWLHQGQAYIMTGASSKQEFGHFRTLFTDTFRSFYITNDLLEELAPDVQKKLRFDLTALTKVLQTEATPKKVKEEKIGQLYTYLTKECKEQGPYWHYLVLKKLENDVGKQPE